MCEFDPRNDSRRLDPCMKSLMPLMKRSLEYSSLEVVACCCGHRKYPKTIIIKDNVSGRIFDLMSGKTIKRKKKFYKKDADGYYFIPEVIK